MNDVLNQVLVSIIVLLGSFMKGLSGVGFGLIVMSTLPLVLPVKLVVPVVALLKFITSATLLVYHRQAFKLRAVITLLIGAILTVPIGVLAFKTLNEKYILIGAGLVVVSYALYGLFGPPLQKLKSSVWGYIFGALSGLLSGAYNIGGPPLIIYANSCQWNPDEFKSNLQSVLMINITLVVITHFFEGSFTPEVAYLFLITLPAMVIGLFSSGLLSKYVNQDLFRTIVLIMLVFMGIKLMI